MELLLKHGASIQAVTEVREKDTGFFFFFTFTFAELALCNLISFNLGICGIICGCSNHYNWRDICIPHFSGNNYLF